MISIFSLNLCSILAEGSKYFMSWILNNLESVAGAEFTEDLVVQYYEYMFTDEPLVRRGQPRFMNGHIWPFRTFFGKHIHSRESLETWVVFIAFPITPWGQL